jgi:DNA-binding transcriptional LysR family regulator
MNLDVLKTLDAIVRRGSFAAAAEELDRAPSAVSYSIQRLEEDAGVLIFDRSGRKATLTAAGELILQRGRQLLEAWQQLMEQARALETGWESRITLALDAIYPASALWPLVQRFYEQAPNTDLRIVSEVLGGPWDALEQGRAELAVAPLQLRPPTGTRSRPVGRVRFIYVCAPDHPLASATRITDDILARHRAIAVADTSRHQPPRSSRLLHNQPLLTVSDFSGKISALEAGLGIGTLPAGMAQPLIEAGRLAAMNVADAAPAVDVHLAWRTDSSGKALRWLVRHLPDYLGDA